MQSDDASELNVAFTVTTSETAKTQYAPVSAVVDRSMVIVSVVPNPKKKDSKCHARYERFHRAGQTIGEYVAAYTAAKLDEKLALC